MNTMFTIITAAIVVGVIIMLIIMAISDHISYKRWRKDVAKRKALEERNNDLLSSIKRVSLRNEYGYELGFIKCYYAFGKWHVQYEYIDSNFIHHAVSCSYDDNAQFVSRNGRHGCKPYFECYLHEARFNVMTNKMINIINSIK